jgi:iron only hydrogenase large subunit-like protein
MVNYWYKQYIEANPNQKYYITSPCPIVVSFIEKKYPEFVEFLIPYASPMQAMSKIAKKNFPDYKIVFISPCQAKRLLEAPKLTEYIDLVITFKELRELLDAAGINAEDLSENHYPFDSFITESTKIYPISGGLAQTSHVRSFFKKEEICIADTIPNIDKVLAEMRAGTSPYKFIDILNCVGGCIGGPDIINRDMPLEEKKQLIIDYRDRSIIDLGDGQEGKKDYALDIDFDVKF